MKMEEMLDLIKQTENKEILARIAHKAMIRVCMLERSMGAWSEITFKKKGVITKMNFDIETIETEGGEG